MLNVYSLFSIALLLSPQIFLLWRSYQTQKNIATIFNTLSEFHNKISLINDSIYGINTVSIASLNGDINMMRHSLHLILKKNNEHNYFQENK